MAELPMEILLYHILPRLPAKSVIRFMTVSKEFYFFLKTPTFANMHLHHVTHHNNHQNNDKLVVLSPTKPLFSTIDYDAPDDVLTPPNRPVPFLTYDFPHITMLTSFHGLICVGVQTITRLGQYSHLVLWNPVTAESKILSKTYFIYGKSDRFGLSYSSSDDDYKLVHATWLGNVYIYSLKSDSWKKLDLESTSKLTLNRSVQMVWFNENLYIIFSPFSIIMRFDTKAEMLTDITGTSLPRLKRLADLFVHDGCIHLFVRNPRTQGNSKDVEIWRLNEDRDWTKVNARKKLALRSLYLQKKSTRVRIFGGMPAQRFTETLVSPNRYRNN